MCGIAGYLGKNLPSKKRINLAIQSMHHRGPDGSGYFIHDVHPMKALLTHNRLAIIDLNDRSNQPFFFKNHVVVFNGEIYNYLEVKNILVKLGHSFKTNSDTEVLVHTLDEWGINGLNQLEGMWAFSWYDCNTGELTLSRDRFGEKPLYLLKNNEGLYFGSEIKAISRLLSSKIDINLDQIYRYLVNGYKSLYKSGETFFQNVFEIKPGTCLKISQDNKFKEISYWQKDFSIDQKLSYSEVTNRVRSLLIDAVKLRLRSDVPLAFCMSGGIDSNSLISIAKNIFNYDVQGFTIINTDKRYEELDMISHAVEQQNLNFTPVEIRKELFLDNLKNLVIQHDSPVLTISYYIHWQLMNSIAENGYKVSISGTGADELFTGYYDHHNLYLKEISTNVGLFNKSLFNWKKYQEKIVRNPYLKDPELYIKNPKFREHIYLDNRKFSSFLKNNWKENFIEKDFCNSLLRNRMLNELFYEAVPIILHEDDLNAMSFSIENRSPFLDRNLFEFAFSIPSKYLIRNGMAKAVLRDAMRGIVPEEILKNRRKVGFNAPFFDLFDITDKSNKEYLLDSSIIFEFVEKSAIENMSSNDKLLNSESKFLFNFLNAKIFLEEYY